MTKTKTRRHAHTTPSPLCDTALFAPSSRCGQSGKVQTHSASHWASDGVGRAVSEGANAVAFRLCRHTEVQVEHIDWAGVKLCVCSAASVPIPFCFPLYSSSVHFILEKQLTANYPLSGVQAVYWTPAQERQKWESQQPSGHKHAPVSWQHHKHISIDSPAFHERKWENKKYR